MIRHSAPTLGDAEAEAVTEVLRSGQLAQGKQVEAFEQECAAFVGRKYGVAVSSGTAALHLALAALGVTENSIVALPTYACAALATAVQMQRGTSALCDVGPDYNLDLGTLPEEVDVSIAAHLFGATASLPKSGSCIEDIAQSLGGDTGTATDVAIASFYATKLMTTGEGGMLLTDDADLAAFARDRRDYDNRDDWLPRYSYKMTDMQAAMGRVQLQRLPGFIARRREIAQQYLDAFRDLPIELPSGSGHVFFRFVIRTGQRESLEGRLADAGVEAKRPVYRPAHLYARDPLAHGDFRLRDSYPGADAAHAQALSLPIYPSLLEDDVAHVIDSVRRNL